MADRFIGYEGITSPTQNNPMDDPPKRATPHTPPEKEASHRVRANGRPGRPRKKEQDAQQVK